MQPAHILECTYIVYSVCGCSRTAEWRAIYAKFICPK